VGHRHSRDDILDGAIAAALDDGISQLTFGRLAKRLGISDRIIVYYFPTKNELVSEVILAMGLRLQTALAPAFGSPVASHLELVGRAWPLLATTDNDAVFALFFEANGLAAVGREPYDQLVPALVTGFVDWAEAFVDAPDSRAEAAAAIAIIDGLLLLRQLAGAETSDRAAATITGP
jgi:AcrR family transcriptional regulator